MLQTDKRVPLIAIPTEQAPPDFVENHQSYAQQLFVVSINYIMNILKVFFSF